MGSGLWRALYPLTSIFEVVYSMFKNRLPTVLSIALIIFLGGAFFLILNQRTHAGVIPDTQEARDVIAALERAYEVLDTPFEQLELNQLSEVFRNDPSYMSQLSADEVDYLKDIPARFRVKQHLMTLVISLRCTLNV